MMSYDIVKEDVPGFMRRLGDRVIEGSNNVIVICGADRSAPGEAGLDSGFGHINAADGGVGAGAYHVIAGRTGPNPNFDTDRSYLYLSMRTDIDKNTVLSGVEFDTNDVSGVILKSDAVRILGRKDIKIHVDKTYVTLNGTDTIVVGVPGPGTGRILLGSKAIEPLVFGKLHQTTFNAFVAAFNALVRKFNTHFHQTGPAPMAPTSPPAIAPFVPVTPPPPPGGPAFLPAAGALPAGEASKMPDADLSKISKTK